MRSSRTIVIHLREGCTLRDPRKGIEWRNERGRNAVPGKKLAGVYRRGRGTRGAANARERNSHYFGPGDVYNPAVLRLPLLPFPARAPLVVRTTLASSVSSSSSFSPVSPLEAGGGMRKDCDARMCQGHSIDFSVSRDSHGEAFPVCRAVFSRRTVRATQNSLATCTVVATRFPFQG